MTPEMGRPKATFTDLPPRMTARWSGGKLHYYYQAAGKKKPLGTDKAEALRQWAIEEAGSIGSHFLSVADAYEKHITPLLSSSSQRHYSTALGVLCKSFRRATLEEIEPRHIKDYIRRRSKKGAALFEKRVLSAMFNWAREEGITKAPNPCSGIKFSQAERKAIGKLGKRDVYVTDAMFAEVYQHADQELRDCMDLALLTGQRPSDILRWKRQDIRESALWTVQVKTGAKVGHRLEGELRTVLERILARPRAVQSMYLIADDKGQPITYSALNKRFVKARDAAGEKWQFRDIRAKAATDSPDLARASKLLGHATETTTTIYRRRKGEAVPPLK